VYILYKNHCIQAYILAQNTLKQLIYKKHCTAEAVGNWVKFKEEMVGPTLICLAHKLCIAIQLEIAYGELDL